VTPSSKLLPQSLLPVYNSRSPGPDDHTIFNFSLVKSRDPVNIQGFFTKFLDYIIQRAEDVLDR